VNARVSVKHLVIVGGGFAGLACAHKLAKSDDVRVTLIEKNNYNQFQPFLYQLATALLGTDDIATSLRESFLGQANVGVRTCEVTAADPKTRVVTTRDGATYQGDFLTLAVGRGRV
jgi:NADH:ubiquinone reductase (H+-translocating)